MKPNHPLGHIPAASPTPVDQQFLTAAKRTEAELMAALRIPPAILKVPLCDFCETPESAAWYYPLGTFKVSIGGHEVEMEGLGVLGGGYNVCETCRAFVEADDYVGLAAHVGYHQPEIGAQQLIRSFRDRRIGPAQSLQVVG